MEVKLINVPTLEFVDSAIGQCWGKGAYGVDNTKGLERIDRVCNKFQHSSMLRFVNYVFECKASTSVLIELSRHTQGVNLAVKSTRYCTKGSVDNIEVDYSGNTDVDMLIAKHITKIVELIKSNPSIGNDQLKLLLPQAFVYQFQVQFNAQSLQHFLKLRTAKGAHFQIREYAMALYNAIPESHKFLFEDSLAKESKDD